jgi:hypothetical protein
MYMSGILHASMKTTILEQCVLNTVSAHNKTELVLVNPAADMLNHLHSLQM